MGDDVAVVDVLGQRDIERDGGVHGAPPLLAQRRKRTRVVEAASEDLLDGFGEELGAVEIEELERACDHRAEVSADVDPALVKGVDSRDRGAEAIASLRLLASALLVEDRLPVFRGLDRLASIPGAFVDRDEAGAVEDAEFAIVGGQRERRSDVLGRHGVRVRVEATEGGLVDPHRDDLVGGDRRIRQWEQPRALLFEAIPDGAGRERRVRSFQRDLVEEHEELTVAL
ncbi:MAG TPA: hypothetical protein VN033_09210 [Vulgatibacter sp.]|nr:hypothetical protein [Vulgatibacter sp.]